MRNGSRQTSRIWRKTLGFGFCGGTFPGEDLTVAAPLHLCSASARDLCALRDTFNSCLSAQPGEKYTRQAWLRC